MRTEKIFIFLLPAWTLSVSCLKMKYVPIKFPKKVLFIGAIYFIGLLLRFTSHSLVQPFSSCFSQTFVFWGEWKRDKMFSTADSIFPHWQWSDINMGRCSMAHTKRHYQHGPDYHKKLGETRNEDLKEHESWGSFPKLLLSRFTFSL